MESSRIEDVGTDDPLVDAAQEHVFTRTSVAEDEGHQPSSWRIATNLGSASSPAERDGTGRAKTRGRSLMERLRSGETIDPADEELLAREFFSPLES